MPRPLLDCFAPCAPGIEAITAAEAIALGLRSVRTVAGGISFRATTRELYVANLGLRTANRVLVRVGSYEARDFDDLVRGAQLIDWSPFLDGEVVVRASSRASKLFHTGAIAERIVGVLGPGARIGSAGEAEPASAAGRPSTVGGSNDAAASRRTSLPGGRDARGFEETDGSTAQPRSSDARPARWSGAQQVLVRLDHDRVILSVDASGDHLHRRGWRLATAKAPMRETLAAALLLACGWDGSSALTDPFCGSGTIAIEAALLARNVAPGIGRAFACQEWPSFEPGTWASALGAAQAATRPAAGIAIVAGDRDAGAIRATRENAERAGVAADVEIRRVSVTELAPPDGPPGWVITNPPYGERVHSGQALYGAFGHALARRWAGWRVGMVVADPALAALTGLVLTEVVRTTNGGIPVRFQTATVPN